MWLDLGIVALLIIGVYCFAVLTGFETRLLTRRSDRRAEDMYDQYADSPRKQGGSPGSTAVPGRTGRPTAGPVHRASGTSAQR